MAKKFVLGDRVSYIGKRPDREFLGTIVAIDKVGTWDGRADTYYAIIPDTPQQSSGRLYFAKLFYNGADRLTEYFRLNDSSWLNNHTKEDACWVSSRSTCLSYGMLEYSPTQEGDKADDI